ncbi:hypothetical protein NP493_81g00015 [Ridgeia piscesae]|uniref:Uncharacterized protein n=1 Tax=Ridgeia piscesae TaxID=27915 RepID=A0AAD9P951_RIDPI|nr:hypothetical protein NP493_81g00015 [Ridgeia piscesae]
MSVSLFCRSASISTSLSLITCDNCFIASRLISLLLLSAGTSEAEADLCGVLLSVCICDKDAFCEETTPINRCTSALSELQSLVFSFSTDIICSFSRRKFVTSAPSSCISTSTRSPCSSSERSSSSRNNDALLAFNSMTTLSFNEMIFRRFSSSAMFALLAVIRPFIWSFPSAFSLRCVDGFVRLAFCSLLMSSDEFSSASSLTAVDEATLPNRSISARCCRINFVLFSFSRNSPSFSTLRVAMNPLLSSHACVTSRFSLNVSSSMTLLFSRSTHSASNSDTFAPSSSFFPFSRSYLCTSSCTFSMLSFSCLVTASLSCVSESTC